MLTATDLGVLQLLKLSFLCDVAPRHLGAGDSAVRSALLAISRARDPSNPK